MKRAGGSCEAAARGPEETSSKALMRNVLGSKVAARLMWLDRTEHVGEWQQMGVERKPGARPWGPTGPIRTWDSTLCVTGSPGEVGRKGLI